MGRPVSDKLPIVHGLEEKYARNLYDNLRSGLKSVGLDAQISIGGAGVHWDCSISAIERSSVVHCFALPEGRPEYLTSFRLQGEEMATARTASSTGASEAILCWLEGSDLTALYQRFTFVDDCRRRLASIRDRVIEFAPCLRTALSYSTGAPDFFTSGFARRPVRQRFLSMVRTRHPTFYVIGTSAPYSRFRPTTC